MLDSHQHFWKLARNDYDWLSPGSGIIYRDFLPEDLRPHMERCGITRTIAVQAAETEAETDFLLQLAEKTDFIAGVVGWLDFDSEGFEARLTHYRGNRFFVGVRPVLQGLPDDDFILRPQVLKNLRVLADAGLPLDILTFPRHLPYVLQALEQTPGLRAVVDHISKPGIAQIQFEPWAGSMAKIAAFPNVFCKVSGMVTEASENWKLEDFRQYVDHIAGLFGPDRLMFGSDWPVCLLAASYAEVVNLARTLLSAHFSTSDLAKIFEKNGAAFYGV
ncbi:amidohydrolase family protein [Oryzifoliimicrobium ureilyticus]|uniref:amidohydrolase family protein n=1 Tax=Oryzifoliimicrobium ureilyticus TaxID=3113724 RepID=UPI00307607F2